jgi:hypothetical protein
MTIDGGVDDDRQYQEMKVSIQINAVSMMKDQYGTKKKI